MFGQVLAEYPALPRASVVREGLVRHSDVYSRDGVCFIALDVWEVIGFGNGAAIAWVISVVSTGEVVPQVEVSLFRVGKWFRCSEAGGPKSSTSPGHILGPVTLVVASQAYLVDFGRASSSVS